MRSLCAALALFALMALALSACSNTPDRPIHKGDDSSGIGPFLHLEEGKEAPRWHLVGLGSDAPTLLRVRNLMGDVIVRESPDADLRLEVVAADGKLPGFAELREYQGSQHLFVLDSAQEIDADSCELPTTRSDGGVTRLGFELPRVDVKVWLPRRAILTIDACAAADINVNADVRVRAGSSVYVGGGEGTLMAWTPTLVCEGASIDLYANASHSVNISASHGAKVIRGQCQVEISRGSGLLDVETTGDVLVQTLVSGGYPRTNLQDFAHRDDFAPIGPELSVFGSRGAMAEKSRTGSRLLGKKVRALLNASSRLEIDVTVSHGEARLRMANPSIVTLHEWTNSTARLTIGNPTGELLIYAVELAEVLVEE